ncbi:MATE family Na+-driven efflux transporter [Mycoplasmopsis adleri]|uniref:MATE family Na+-driven efflux transporter n=1 Tax=Mycoplasmopsis adleri TaxID=51362 RepID=UPI0038736D13
MPNNWSYSIAGQLAWINLIYEIINEGIILPLFYFIGKVINNKKDLTNRIKTGLLMSFIIYLFLSGIIIAFANPLLRVMATNKEILYDSTVYIRLEAIANIFIILQNFVLICLTVLNKRVYFYIITFLQLFLYVSFDTFLVSTLRISANLGVNGIAISNILVNLILFAMSLIFLNNAGINIFTKSKLSFAWMKEFLKVGGISSLESFIRNLAYMLMISRMINVVSVSEQGTYWVANSFIWGWLLLPINQLAELIKQEASTQKNSIQNNSLGYFFLTTIIAMIWLITIPLYKPFMRHVLNYKDADKLFNLVLILLGFYILYALQNVFDATFYGLEKTQYMLFESIVTNTLYYGIAFILYKAHVWNPTLINIALLFGIGMAFDSIVSLIAYWYLLRKYKINILDVKKVNKKILLEQNSLL